MQTFVRDLLCAVIMGLVLPGILLCFGTHEESANEVEQEQFRSKIDTEIAVPMLLHHRDDTLEIMDMETYVLCVVLAEMPADFEMEALKAQAVAARTYTRKAWEKGGKHGDGSVCTVPSCCQGFISAAEYLEQGGTEENLEKVRAAVNATEGLVLTYQGELIEACYFSCSGGSTEDAQAVWGMDYPYLQATISPGEESAVYYSDTITFTPEQLRGILDITGNSDPAGWFGSVTYTDGGGVDKIMIGRRTFTGPELRALLHLRSTAFSVSVSDSGITFTTKGYGHRVGMSQYGADAMAAAGSSFAQILAHYYQGTELRRLDMDQMGAIDYKQTLLRLAGGFKYAIGLPMCIA